ncbi:MAG: hypothetical protein V9G20_28705 [Candidatus Promineifilaceae bacterium]
MARFGGVRPQTEPLGFPRRGMGLQAGLIGVAAAGQNRAVGFSPAGDGSSGWSYWGRGRWTKPSRWVFPGGGWAFRLVLLGSRPLDKTEPLGSPRRGMGLQAGLIGVAAAGQNRAVGFSPAGDGPSGWSYLGRGRWTKHYGSLGI